MKLKSSEAVSDKGGTSRTRTNVQSFLGKFGKNILYQCIEPMKMNKVKELEFKLQLLLGEKYIVKCWAEGASSAITRRPLFKINVYIYRGTKLVYMDHEKIGIHTVKEANFDTLEERVIGWYKDPFVTIRDVLSVFIFVMAAIGTIGSFVAFLFFGIGLRTTVDISWWIVIPTVSFLCYYYCYKMYELIFK